MSDEWEVANLPPLKTKMRLAKSLGWVPGEKERQWNFDGLVISTVTTSSFFFTSIDRDVTHFVPSAPLSPISNPSFLFHGGLKTNPSG